MQNLSMLKILRRWLHSRVSHTGKVGRCSLVFSVQESRPIHFFWATEDGGGGNIPSASKRLLASSKAQVWILNTRLPISFLLLPLLREPCKKI